MPDNDVIPVWADIIAQMTIGTEAANAPDLLRQVALAATYRRAGMVTPVAKTPLDLKPAPPETLRAFALRDAGLILAYERQMPISLLIPLWLTLLFRKHKRVPHSFLPQFLAMGKTSPHLIPYLLRVLGERGRWMIEGDEDYAYLRQPVLFPEDDDTLIAKSLDDWKQHPRYVTWASAMMLGSYQEKFEKDFAELYETLMEGLTR